MAVCEIASINIVLSKHVNMFLISLLKGGLMVLDQNIYNNIIMF